MRKSGKVFWLLVSIVFAVSAIAVGSMYDSRRKKDLELTTEKVTQPVTKESKKETKNNKTVTNTTESSAVETESTDSIEKIDDSESTGSELAAQELINVIIMQGQVQSDFTLDDYYAAKTAVDQLPESPKKQELLGQIQQIQTALTNMGISY